VDERVETYRVVTDRGEDPATDDGLAVLRWLLGDAVADAPGMQTFSTVMPPGTHLGSHRHSAAFAAGVVSGRITFVFGADGTGRFELEPGHYVWVDADVMHDEETSDGVELIVGHVDPLETRTD
jgi:hypothetical protein